MIAHVVLFRPKATLSPSDRAALVAAMQTAMTQIPSVRRAQVGTRITHGRPYEQLMKANYSHAAILEFDDLDGLQAYLRHPAHEELAARFFAAFDDALFYDYVLGEDAASLL